LNAFSKWFETKVHVPIDSSDRFTDTPIVISASFAVVFEAPAHGYDGHGLPKDRYVSKPASHLLALVNVDAQRLPAVAIGFGRPTIG
jgi:hypothetical protein